MSSTTQAIIITSPTTRAKELALSARKLLDDLKELEAGMILPNNCSRPRRTVSLSSSSSRRRSLPHRTSSICTRQSLLACHSLLDSSTSATLAKSINKKRVTGAFMTFCEHLLFMNRIWKQQRQLQALQASIKAAEKAKCSNAFKAFCDRLLLTNRIWQLERQVEELAAEGERNKRARVAAITHAAKQMARDVRKESMIEEFVLDLIKELQESKQVAAELRGEHEKEIREIQGDWLKEHRRLLRENELLQLEHHARLVEQDVSNDFEQLLFDGLQHSRQRITELEQGDGDSTLIGDVGSTASLLGSDDVDELDEMDEGMSITSSVTCVSFGELPSGPGKSLSMGMPQGRNSTTNRIQSSKSLIAAAGAKRLLRRQSMPLRKLDTTPYAGFSFNPLFFGSPETLVVSPSRVENAETPAKVTLKLAPSLPKASIRERKDSATRAPTLAGPTNTRGPWKI